MPTSSRPSTPTPSLTTYLSTLPGTVSSFLTRLAEPSPSPTPPSRHLTPQPPIRRASPYQPPPLPSLTLSAPNADRTTLLLSIPLAEEIRLLLPPRLQLVDGWSLRYGLARDGVSLGTLYKRVAGLEGEGGMVGGWVLVVKDGGGGTFGAYLSHPPSPSPHFYGTGECFLWRSTTLPSLPPPPSADTTRLGRSTTISSVSSDPPSPIALLKPNMEPTTMRFKAFPYSGLNEYLILCDAHFLSLGGGDGKYGLWLDDVFENGISSACDTFGNEPLSDDGEKFEVLGVEIWAIGGGLRL
ncbi:MAG: oxidation resistance protein 1 [Vezdaea aestivalis]|nr:MAG: oxidation resistance protein 1 [Vezdaea aestivalis]